jgi:DNA-binding transcriptional LysR family regulator
VVGTDLLVPVSAPDASGVAPRWALPGTAAAPVRLLAYSGASGLGRILEAARRSGGGAPPLSLETVFTSPLAAALQTMARGGGGVAWLPRTMAAEDLAAGRLVEAGGGGGGAFSVGVEIRLFRPKRRQSGTAEAFWTAVSRQSPSQGRGA